MLRLRRNKSELIVLTGAIYSFVAYLTAFTLEILFLVDLGRQQTGGDTSEPPGSSSATGRPPGPPIQSPGAAAAATSYLQSADSVASSFERFALEAMQAHITISCLALAILYFVIFITSLTLIVALILRSTFLLLIWMCAMTTMYLPEFALVVYVSAYSWGLGTRNGQTELAFFLLRATLNLIFIFRAHKLFKQWNYEKNFFRLKSGGGISAALAASHFGAGGYDSPYFISGDSLTTTINPVFSSSTLNLNRYDYVRSGASDHPQDRRYRGGHPGLVFSRNTSPTTNQSVFSATTNTELNLDSGSQESFVAGGRGRLAAASMYSRELAQNHRAAQPGGDAKFDKYYLGDASGATPPPAGRTSSALHQTTASSSPTGKQMQRPDSALSINDDLDADYEIDLDYRTLNKRRDTRYARPPPATHDMAQHSPPAAHYYSHYNHRHQGRQPEPFYCERQQQVTMVSRSQDNLAYSTQSLDRRNLRDLGPTEQVVLRPLGHQPFEYLQRPGSTSDLNSKGVSTNTSGGVKSNHRHYHYAS